MAIFKLGRDPEGNPLSRDDFEHNFLPRNRHLLKQNLWRDYYSESLILSPQSERYYRLPDLKSLPDPNVSLAHRCPSSSQCSYSERIPRFAFAVVCTYLATNLDRQWVIKQATSALQSTTMSIRAKCSAMPPYSETQTMYWICRVHKLLCSVISKLDSKANVKGTNSESSLKTLSFGGFRAIVPLDCNDWTSHYSITLWNSVAARAMALPPDIRPLPIASRALPNLTMDKILHAERVDKVIGLSPELPSDQELALYLAISVKQASVDVSFPFADYTHGQMLFSLFRQLDAYQSSNDGGVNFAEDVANALPGSLSMELDSRVFWCEQVLEALIRFRKTTLKSGDTHDLGFPTFERFLRGNIHLAYHGLEAASWFSRRKVRKHGKADVSSVKSGLESPEKLSSIEDESLEDDSNYESAIEKMSSGLAIESWEII